MLNLIKTVSEFELGRFMEYGYRRDCQTSSIVFEHHSHVITGYLSIVSVGTWVICICYIYVFGLANIIDSRVVSCIAFGQNGHCLENMVDSINMVMTLLI